MYIKAEDMDLLTGRNEIDMDVAMQDHYDEKQRWKQKPWWYKALDIWC